MFLQVISYAPPSNHSIFSHRPADGHHRHPGPERLALSNMADQVEPVKIENLR